MIAKENPNKPPREKAAATPPTAEHAGEGVKAGTANAAAAAAAGVAQGARGASANGTRPAYVPARRRSRRNLLL